MKNAIEKSPIFYMGNKERLIKSGMLNLFPNNIETFYDLFGGSGVVTLNTKSNKYILNDIDSKIYELYKMFKENNGKCILEFIDGIIEKFDIKPGIHKQGFTKKYPELEYPREEQDDRIEKYNKLRNYYNNAKDIRVLYVLSIFCNSHNIRFNKDGNFNMSIGNSGFIDSHRREIENMHNILNEKEVEITNKNFNMFDISKMNNDDFLYIDPPYLNSLAIYNEQQKWDLASQDELFDFLDKVHSNGIKFAMSNVFSNKGKENKELVNWVIGNKFNVYEFKDMKYTSCGKGNSNAKEVLITNY